MEKSTGALKCHHTSFSLLLVDGFKIQFSISSISFCYPETMENNPHDSPASSGGPPKQRLSLPGPSRSEVANQTHQPPKIPSNPLPPLQPPPPRVDQPSDSPANAQSGASSQQGPESSHSQPSSNSTSQPPPSNVQLSPGLFFPPLSPLSQLPPQHVHSQNPNAPFFYTTHHPPQHVQFVPASQQGAGFGSNQPSQSLTNAQSTTAMQPPPAPQPPLGSSQFAPISQTSMDDAQIFANLQQAIGGSQYVSPQDTMNPPSTANSQQQAFPRVMLDPMAQQAMDSAAARPTTQNFQSNPFTQQPMQNAQPNPLPQKPIQKVRLDSAAFDPVVRKAMEDSEFVPASFNRPFNTLLPDHLASIPPPPGYYWGFLGAGQVRLVQDLDTTTVKLPDYFDKKNPPRAEEGMHWGLVAEMNGLQLAMVYRATEKEPGKAW
ncbi:hypothetical protein HDK77DRAFT_498019 [Phyllosticta capitalensis]